MSWFKPSWTQDKLLNLVHLKANFCVLFFLQSIAVWFWKCIWQKQRLPLMEAGPCCLPACHTAPSTHQHTGTSSLKEAAVEIVMCSEGVGVGPYSAQKPDLWHHSACRSKQPQTLAAWTLAAQPSLIALLGCEPRCEHFLSGSKLQTVLPHGCYCAEPPS